LEFEWSGEIRIAEKPSVKKQPNFLNTAEIPSEFLLGDQDQPVNDQVSM